MPPVTREMVSRPERSVTLECVSGNRNCNGGFDDLLDEGVVEAGEDTGYAEDELALLQLGSELNILLFLVISDCSILSPVNVDLEVGSH